MVTIYPKFSNKTIYNKVTQSSKLSITEIVEKIKNSSLIKKDLISLIREKLKYLREGNFFESEEKVEHLAIKEYKKPEFEEFKDKIKPILIKICEEFLKNKTN